ncbi:MAG TPA: ABC-2 transporter permease [Bryobacteraceae bacterium]|nr:ABC-2 transporter permease [Bryobacteraceae bacterium]
MSWTAYEALVRRDLKLFFRDRRAVLMSFAAPILIGSFFGYLFGGVTGSGDTAKIPVAVIDQDGSSISRHLVAGIASDKALELRQVTLDQANSEIRAGKLTVAAVIPKDFGDHAAKALFRATDKPEITFMYDPSHGAELAMVRGMFTQHAMEAVSSEAMGGNSKLLDETMKEVQGANGMNPADQKSLVQLLGSVQQWNARLNANPQASGEPRPGLSMPYTVREEAILAHKGAQYNAYGHAFGGMGVQFILMMGMDAGLVLLLQRQGGIWKRLRAAPISRATIVAARVTSAMIDAVVIQFVIFGFARVVFGVRVEGSMLGFFLLAVAIGLMTGGFGMLVAGLGKTVEATRGLAILATLMMVMLGGAWVPAFLFPQWLQKVTFAVPTRWAVDGLDGMTWRGLGFDAAIAPIAALIGFAVLFTGLAVWRFRWDG